MQILNSEAIYLYQKLKTHKKRLGGRPKPLLKSCLSTIAYFSGAKVKQNLKVPPWVATLAILSTVLTILLKARELLWQITTYFFTERKNSFKNFTASDFTSCLGRILP